MLSIVVVEGPILRDYYNHTHKHTNNKTSCGRSSFEGLLQPFSLLASAATVVEGPVLRDYYNMLLYPYL